MAKPTTPGQREQQFAFFLAHGLTCSEAARRAGYSQATVHSKSSHMAKRGKIVALVETYRASFAILDGGLLQRCLNSLLAIMEQASSSEIARFRAAIELVHLYQAFQNSPYSTDMARRLYQEEQRLVNPTEFTPLPTKPKS